jgi:hypothetical protein
MDPRGDQRKDGAADFDDGEFVGGREDAEVALDLLLGSDGIEQADDGFLSMAASSRRCVNASELTLSLSNLLRAATWPKARLSDGTFLDRAQRGRARA